MKSFVFNIFGNTNFYMISIRQVSLLDEPSNKLKMCVVKNVINKSNNMFFVAINKNYEKLCEITLMLIDICPCSFDIRILVKSRIPM